MNISEDSIRGSNELLNATLEVLNRYKGQIASDQLEWTFDTLNTMDPAMATFRHFINEMQPEIQGNFWNSLEGYISKWTNVEERISHFVKTEFDINNVNILTHSCSSTVQKVLAGSEKSKVFQTKSNPGGEGQMQADVLPQKGVEVELILDTEIESVLNEITLCIMGCDQYSTDSFINKIGSYTISEMAIDRNIPVIILADSRKCVDELTKTGVFFEITEFVPGMHLVTESGLKSF